MSDSRKRILELHTVVDKKKFKGDLLFFIWPLYVYLGDFFFLQSNLSDWRETTISDRQMDQYN